MNWLDGYAASWRVTTVDTSTWADSGELPNVMSVSVSRDGTDPTPLIETGTMQIEGDFSWGWLRLWMAADQGGSEREPLATLLFERSSESYNRNSKTCRATGMSVLKPAADVRMPRGGFCPAGADGAAYAARLLSGCTPAPVHVEGSMALVNDVVFDLGCTVLDAAWSLLNPSGWCIQIDGMGEIWIRRLPSEPSLELNGTTAGLLIPGVDSDSGIAGVPNRYIAQLDSETAIAVNEDASSEASYKARGRWVDVFDGSPVLVDGEDLQAYAERRLAELSTITRKYRYKREYWPGVTPYSIVRATLESNGLDGDLRVMRQTLTCGKGITVDEESGLEVRI